MRRGTYLLTNESFNYLEIDLIMSFTESEKPDSKAPARPNTPVIVRTSTPSPTGSTTPSTSFDYNGQNLLNEVSLRLERLSLEDQVFLDKEELETS